MDDTNRGNGSIIVVVIVIVSCKFKLICRIVHNVVPKIGPSPQKGEILPAVVVNLEGFIL